MHTTDDFNLKLLYENVIKKNYAIEAERNAKNIFGSDSYPARRGYIYEDGQFLNLHDGLDHREINKAFISDDDSFKDIKIEDFYEKLGSSKYMITFMDKCKAIRWAVVGRDLTMSYIHKPNYAQKSAITKLISELNIDTAHIDKFNNQYETIKSSEGDIWDHDVQRML